MKQNNKLTFKKLTLTALTGFLAIITTSFATAAAPSAEYVFSATPYLLSGGHVQFSSPTLVDLTGDGQLEILVGTTACSNNPCVQDQQTTLEVWKSDGTQLWARNVGGPINSSPSVGDIDNDGFPEIVVSVGGAVNDVDQHGGIVVYERDGTFKWRFTTNDTYPQDGYSDGVYSTPALCDMTGDGYLEIAFGAWDQRIYLLDHNKNPVWANSPNGWPGIGYLNGDSSWSSPACADLNGDGQNEIIIGADITGGGILPDGTQPADGGFLYVFGLDSNQPLVRRYLPEAIYSSPAVGDLDGDGQLEIVVGTGWFWWNQHGRTSQPYVYVFDTSNIFSSLAYDNPSKLPHLPGWPRPTNYPGFSSPALADLDGDGTLEVIIGTGDPFLNNGDPIPGAGSVYAWHHDGQLVSGWPVHPKNSGGSDAPIFSSPIVADIDDDGQYEILISSIWDVNIYNADGSFQERLETAWTVWAAPAVGDTDGDGKVEVWVAGGNQWVPDKGVLYRFENGADDPGSHPWPMFRGNAAHTGRGGNAPANLQLNISEITVLSQQGSNISFNRTLILRNAGDLPLDWQATLNGTGLSVTPNTGTIPGQTSQAVHLTISSEDRPLGVHNLSVGLDPLVGQASVSLDGSLALIPITVYVVPAVHSVYLPLVTQ